MTGVLLFIGFVLLLISLDISSISRTLKDMREILKKQESKR